MLDSVDRKILTILQHDARTPVAEIAAQVGLSQSPCWRRVQRLRADGYITREVALLDPRKLNVGVTVFVAVRTNQHTEDWLEAFASNVAAIPEVMEFYRMSGEIDYLLRIVVPDIGRYDAVYRKLIRAAPIADVSSSFAMETIKYSTALPLSYAE